MLLSARLSNGHTCHANFVDFPVCLFLVIAGNVIPQPNRGERDEDKVDGVNKVPIVLQVWEDQRRGQDEQDQEGHNHETKMNQSEKEIILSLFLYILFCQLAHGRPEKSFIALVQISPFCVFVLRSEILVVDLTWCWVAWFLLRILQKSKPGECKWAQGVFAQWLTRRSEWKEFQRWSKWCKISSHTLSVESHVRNLEWKVDNFRLREEVYWKTRNLSFFSLIDLDFDVG